MGRRRDARAKIERGDFQTPPALAAEVCRALAGHPQAHAPRSIVEPTCGTGGLLFAALDAFPGFERALGIEINDAYVRAAQATLATRADADRVRVEACSFFAAEWPALLAELADPILVIGNPPWVTNSDLGALDSDNVPAKANADRFAGLAAMTGKSNFDISEWMVRELLARLAGRAATVAMLCKTSVARKLLAFAWRTGQPLATAALYRIDAEAHFGASVDACLLVCTLAPPTDLATRADACPVFADLAAPAPIASLGFRAGRLIADLALYDHWRVLEAVTTLRGRYHWRSGIKHDCAAVMELRRTPAGFASRAGEAIADAPDLQDLEDRWLYPLWKSSDVARGRADDPPHYLLVTQARVGDDTQAIEASAPRTWRYLTHHRARFDRRASAIYRGKPPFAIFGVGDYTFAPWKVAISGLYKKLAFCVVGPHADKPVVFDDTCYFLACASEDEARLIAALLASEPAQAFYQSQVFWDAKRPITTELLRRLDLPRLAALLGRADELAAVTKATASPATPPRSEAGPDSRSAQTA
jgi:hypothetical protein